MSLLVEQRFMLSLKNIADIKFDELKKVEYFPGKNSLWVWQNSGFPGRKVIKMEHD